MVSSGFFVYVPSNVRKEGNRTSSFSVTLPKTLNFSSLWSVALTSISYANHFLNLGTYSLQYVDIEWTNSKISRLYFPSSTVVSPKDLQDQLQYGIENGYLCDLKGPHQRSKRQTPSPGSSFPPAVTFDAREQLPLKQQKELPPLRDEKTSPLATIPLRELQPNVPLKEKPHLNAPLVEAPLKEQPELNVPLLEAPMKEQPAILKTPILDVPMKEQPDLNAPLLDVPLKEKPDLNAPLLNVPLKEKPPRYSHKFDLKERKRTFERLLLPDPTGIQRHRHGVPELTVEDSSRFPKTNIKFDDQAEDYELDEDWEKCHRDPQLQLPSIFQIEYNSSLQKFEVKFDVSQIKSLQFSNQLAYILGLLKNHVEKPTLAEFIPEMNAGIQNMYIYAPSLVEHSIVGDKMAPLLRIVKIKGHQGTNNEENFINPEYRKIIDKNISELSFQIRSNTGRLLDFISGDILLTLHFRKILF